MSKASYEVPAFIIRWLEAPCAVLAARVCKSWRAATFHTEAWKELRLAVSHGGPGRRLPYGNAVRQPPNHCIRYLVHQGDRLFQLATHLQTVAELAHWSCIPQRPDLTGNGTTDVGCGASEVEVYRYTFTRTRPNSCDAPTDIEVWLLQFNTGSFGCSTGDRTSIEIPVGLKVWPVCSFVCQNLCGICGPVIPIGARCLELGAGVGLLGVLLAKLGASVTLTDVDELCLSVAKVNMRLNGIGHQDCDCQVLEFGAEEAIAFRAAHGGNGFEFIFAVDVLYVDRTVPMLFETIAELLAPHGCFFLGFVHRHKGVAAELPRAASAAGLTWSEPAHLGDDGMQLYRFTRRGAYRLDMLD